jgi:type I restriction enzyme S subunit
MTWPTKKLGELISKYFSGTWGEDSKGDGNARVIRVSDIKPDFSINYDNVPIRRLKEKDLKKYRLELGDIVVVKSSGNQTKIISGRAALFEYKDKDVYVPSNFLIALRPNRNLIIPMWLWVNLNSKTAKRFIELIIGATTYPNLKPAEYLNLKIPVPPLPIQQKIVGRLDAIKKAQELNDKQIELAEELFQSLLHRELDPKGKNWNLVKLGNFVQKIEYGLSVSVQNQLSDNGVPILTMAEIEDDGQINYQKARKISVSADELRKFKLNDGEILFNWRNEKFLIGKTGLFKSQKEDFIFASFLLRVIPNEKILPEFLWHWLNYLRIKKVYLRHAHLAGNQASYNANSLQNKTLCPSVSLETQQKIVEKLSVVQEYKKKLLDQKQKLQELFESVLNKSFKV